MPTSGPPPGDLPGHLSFLALDGLRLGRPVRADERAHLATCAACAGYLQAGAEAPPVPAPAWLGRLDPAGRPARARGHRPPWRRWDWLIPLAPAAAAALLLWAGRPAPTPSGQGGSQALVGVREKGTPAVRLYVKRGERVFAWDGQGPVRPGDRLRLEVRRADYRFVSVAALGPPGATPEVLYQGPLDAGDPLLPVSFRVDDRGREEVLSVLLGRDPVPERLHALAGAPAGEARTWRQILVLEKQPPIPTPVGPSPAGNELRDPF